jgi:hypothetical protein
MKFQFQDNLVSYGATGSDIMVINDKGTDYKKKVYFDDVVGIKTTPDPLYSLDVSGDVRYLSGNVGIGIEPSSGAYRLNVAGDVNIEGIGNKYYVNNTPIVSSQWATSGTTIEYNGGSVGIGTSALSYKLNVNGSINATSILVNGATLDYNALNNKPITLIPTTTNLQLASGYNFLVGGNVGIGTNNPQTELHINDATTGTTTLTIQNNFTSGSAITSSPSATTTGTIGAYTYQVFTYTTETGGSGSGQSLYTITAPVGGVVCDVLVVGGGGGGGKFGGGAGGGAILFATNITLTSGSLRVGNGGLGAVQGSYVNGVNGVDSSITINSIQYIAKGGGGGGTRLSNANGQNGSAGGSGGGGSHSNDAASQGLGGASNKNTYANFQSFGNSGGKGRPGTVGGDPNHASGGGGGAGSAGSDFSLTTGGGNGGAGIDYSSYFGSSVGHNGWFAGGGGGNTYQGAGVGGYGNGGNGLFGGGGIGGFDGGTEYSGGDGLPNTGGGGGGAKWDGGTNEDLNGGNGGSGVVIIRYLTPSSSSTIELIRGTTTDANHDWKLGNYSGEFKAISSVSGVDTDRLVISSTGNVGIGTSNPSNILQVGSGGRLRIANNTADQTVIGGDDVAIATSSRIELKGSTWQNFTTNDNGNIWYYARGFHLFYVNNDEVMRMVATGVYFSSTTKFFGNNGRTKLYGRVGIGKDEDTTLILDVLGNSRFNGNVGIGTNNPSNILQVGGGGRLRISNSTTDYTLIGTDDVDGTTNTRIVMGSSANPDGANNIIYIAAGNGTHSWETGNRVLRMRLTNNGQLTAYVGMNTPAVRTDSINGNYNAGPLSIDPNYSTNNYIIMYDDVRVQGNFSVSGGTKSWRIKHPILEGKDLIHACIEAPRADNLYRGRKQLINGECEVNIDLECNTTGGMTDGTFELINKNIQVFVNNNETFDRVIGKIVGNKLNIKCENINADCYIDWLVIGERNDDDMNGCYSSTEGSIIVEIERGEQPIRPPRRTCNDEPTEPTEV